MKEDFLVGLFSNVHLWIYALDFGEAGVGPHLEFGCRFGLPDRVLKKER